MGTRDEQERKSTSSTVLDPSLLGRSTQTFIGSVILLGAFLILWMGSETQFLQAPGETTLRTAAGSKVKGNSGGGGNCDTVCDEIQGNAKKNRYYGSEKDLLDTKKLVQRAENAKFNLIEGLRKDYGNKYFDHIFQDGETGEFRPINPITPDGPSMERLKRKLMIKVLSVKKSVNNNDGQCDCLSGNQALLESPPSPPFFEKYVWATGGHSSAAGHGNLYNESYTAYMEQDLINVFGAVGIEFVGRNYAMGGTSAGSEIAMCWEQIFGSDVDFFSWDYGMTDGGTAEKVLMYGLRGGLSPGRPAYMGIHIGGKSKGHREDRIKELEEMGMAGFLFNETRFIPMREAIPDSAGLTEKELADLPDYVRNFKCDGGFEKGEPYCLAEKFSHYICDKRGHQGSWHPGYKDHALVGHAVALFITNTLISALKSLSEDYGDNDDTLLAELRRQDEGEHIELTKAPLPESYSKLYNSEGDGIPNDFDASLFFQGRSFCHTGRLPSQTRYLGYLTESDKVGGPAPWGNVTYDTGLPKKEAIKKGADGVMQLIFEDRDRVRDCPVTCMPDAKDTFMTYYKDGWAKVSLPNAAERKAYRYDPTKHQGIVVIILRSCDWGKCETGFLKSEDFIDKKWEMKVNGKNVQQLVDFGHDALVAKGKDGIKFTPNSEGAYDIEIKVNEEDGFVLVSSFVLY